MAFNSTPQQTKTAAWSNIFSTGSAVVTFDAAAVSGNLVVVTAVLGVATRSVSSVTASNVTFSQAVSQVGTGFAHVSIWYGVATGDVTAVTVTANSSSAANCGVIMYEFMGTHATPTVDTISADIVAQPTGVSSGSVTPITASNLSIAVVHSSTLVSGVPDADFTHTWLTGGGTTQFTGSGYFVQSSIADADWTGAWGGGFNENLAIAVANFNAASDGGGLTPIVMTWTL